MYLRTAVFLLLIAATPMAKAFYCGHFIVAEGDYKLQVLQKCGEPTYYQHRVEYRSVVLRRDVFGQPPPPPPPGPPGKLGFGPPMQQQAPQVMEVVEQRPVSIDEWAYDFGPHRIMKGLYFENDRLLFIKELGYGTLDGGQ